MGVETPPEDLSSQLNALCDTTGQSLDNLFHVGDVIGEGRFSKVY